MFETYLLRLRRHFSSDRLLNIFRPTRAGPVVLLAPTSSPRTGSIFLYGAQGPLCDLGPLPLHYPYFKTIYSTKFMGTMFISSIRTITTKAHVYYPWRNYSFCWDEQAQRSPTTRPRRDSPAHVLISATKAHLSN